MAKETLSVPNITCGHCVTAIKNELTSLEGVIHVEGNPETRSITVEWETPATSEKIREALREINYPAS